MFWNINLNRHIMISVQGRILHRNNTFSFQADFTSGLRSRFDAAKHFAVDGVHQDFSAENGCGKRNPCCGIDVVALSFKSELASYVNFQKQITGRTSADPVHTFAFQTDTLSVADTCGNVNLQILYSLGMWILKMNDLFTSESSIVKRNVDFGVQIFALLSETATVGAGICESPAKIIAVKISVSETACEAGIMPLARAVSVEGTAENVFKDVIHISTLKMKFLVTSVRTSVSVSAVSGIVAVILTMCKRTVFIQAGMTELIIQFLFFCIT